MRTEDKSKSVNWLIDRRLNDANYDICIQKTFQDFTQIELLVHQYFLKHLRSSQLTSHTLFLSSSVQSLTGLSTFALFFDHLKTAYQTSSSGKAN